MLPFNDRYLDAFVEINKAYEYITNHPSLKEHASLMELLRKLLKRLEDECMSVLEQYLQGDKVRMNCLFDCRFRILPVKQTK